jgi:hypothetical protein
MPQVIDQKARPADFREVGNHKPGYGRSAMARKENAYSGDDSGTLVYLNRFVATSIEQSTDVSSNQQRPHCHEAAVS